jgi:hypothetical protein
LNSRQLACLAILAAFGAPRPSLAEPQAAPNPASRTARIPDSALSPKTLKQVGLAYDAAVLPLMKRACFDCHSTQTVFPWYHRLPLVSSYLNRHVEEARKRLDLSDGFPFAGKSPIVFRVRGIGRTVKRGTMPLWDYKLMHPASRLSDDEKKVIIDWSEGSFQKLSETAKPYKIQRGPDPQK